VALAPYKTRTVTCDVALLFQFVLTNMAIAHHRSCLDQFQILKKQFVFSFYNLDSEQKLGCLDLLVFKNLTSFIALLVTRNWQKLGINIFLVFKNLAKSDSKNYSLFGSHLVSKSQILKNYQKLERSK